MTFAGGGRAAGTVGAASHSPCVPAVPGHFSALLVSDGRCPRRGLAASAHRGFAPLLSPPREGGQAAPAARGSPAHGGCSAPPPRAQRCRSAALTAPPAERGPSPTATGGACVTPPALPAAALCNPPLGPAYKTPPRQSHRHSERRGSREVTARAGPGRGGGGRAALLAGPGLG